MRDKETLANQLSDKFLDAFVQFNNQGLVPAIAQQHNSREVLMMAWMDKEAIRRSVISGYVNYWSRSRQKYWRKGEESGHHQRLIEIRSDCDRDCLLLLVDQQGPACHTGRRSCFFHLLKDGAIVINDAVKSS